MFVQGDRSLEQQCLIYTPDCPIEADEQMQQDDVSFYQLIFQYVKMIVY